MNRTDSVCGVLVDTCVFRSHALVTDGESITVPDSTITAVRNLLDCINKCRQSESCQSVGMCARSIFNGGSSLYSATLPALNAVSVIVIVNVNTRILIFIS